MYGYVVPVKDNMLMQDFVLYRAFYCGICKATGKMYGQFPRFTTNYDIVFLSVLMHDCMTQDVEIEESACVCNPFKKKATIQRNELLDKLVAVNLIMSYYKAGDDVIDEGGLKKRVVRRALNKPYKKARAVMPSVEEIFRTRYEALRALERDNCSVPDRVSDCFASMLSDTAKELLGEKSDDNILRLCYNMGKFVYLADALDDVDEDYRKKRYNPLLAALPGYVNRTQFIEDNKRDLEFLLTSTVNRAIECFNRAKPRFTQSTRLMENIVHVGLRAKADELLKSSKKLKKPKI